MRNQKTMTQAEFNMLAPKSLKSSNSRVQRSRARSNEQLPQCEGTPRRRRTGSTKSGPPVYTMRSKKYPSPTASNGSFMKLHNMWVIMKVSKKHTERIVPFISLADAVPMSYV